VFLVTFQLFGNFVSHDQDQEESFSQEKLLSEFNDPNNKQFHDRDLYVFCYNKSDGKITAYESPALLNVDVRTWRSRTTR
jgi:hypothetical protein